jgi:hypothetical protein
MKGLTLPKPHPYWRTKTSARANELRPPFSYREGPGGAFRSRDIRIEVRLARGTACGQHIESREQARRLIPIVGGVVRELFIVQHERHQGIERVRQDVIVEWLSYWVGLRRVDRDGNGTVLTAASLSDSGRETVGPGLGAW